MKIFPAVDLLDGCAVRLERGDYRRKTVYSRDPLSVAAGFREAGASYLHVVDLNGAAEGTAVNGNLIERLIRDSGLRVEVGGGIRDEETVRRYLDAGAMRVILGTAAAESPAFLRKMTERYGGGIAVSADIRDGRVATRGWLASSGADVDAFLAGMAAAGVRTVICTDISRDGMLSGPGMELYRRLCGRHALGLVASGGISSAEDIRRLAGLGMEGAILGKALYEGILDLRAALAAAEEGTAC